MTDGRCHAVYRKRRSPSAGARAEDDDGDWTDTETRCSVAIEGHAAAKYVDRNVTVHVLGCCP